MGKTGENVCIINYCSCGCTQRNLCFHVESCQPPDQKQAHATIDLRSRHGINPRPTRFVPGKANECRWQPRRYQMDPWSMAREFSRGFLRFSPKPKKSSIFCYRGGIDIFHRLLSTYQWPNVFLYQTPGRRPPRITGRVASGIGLPACAFVRIDHEKWRQRRAKENIPPKSRRLQPP